MESPSNLMTLEEFKLEHYGPAGTEKRDRLESDYLNFKKEYLRNRRNWK